MSRTTGCLTSLLAIVLVMVLAAALLRASLGVLGFGWLSWPDALLLGVTVRMVFGRFALNFHNPD